MSEPGKDISDLIGEVKVAEKKYATAQSTVARLAADLRALKAQLNLLMEKQESDIVDRMLVDLARREAERREHLREALAAIPDADTGGFREYVVAVLELLK